MQLRSIPAPCPPALDAVLRSLCPLFFRQADDLLDLRACANSRQRPGKCVDCYFRLSSECPAVSQLCPLREWLESNIEVVAFAGGQSALERLPLRLDGETLESYCHGVMDEIRENRNYSHPEISLAFQFKELAEAA
jgi:hypothetical protein